MLYKNNLLLLVVVLLLQARTTSCGAKIKFDKSNRVELPKTASQVTEIKWPDHTGDLIIGVT